MAENVALSMLTSDYEEKTHVQHVYDVPDTYVGAEDQTLRKEFVFDPFVGKMSKQDITLPIAVERLFLEILSNASDATLRADKVGAPHGPIVISMDNTTISIENGGIAIPVDVKEPNGPYVPEIIFGRLLTSSNYNPNEIRIGCGRNGYGAKLVNIFSKFFCVEVGDASRKLFYRQEWKDNMKERYDPVILPYEGDNLVKITWTLDFNRFGYNKNEYPVEAVPLFMRAAAEFSMTASVPIRFETKEWLDPEGDVLRSAISYLFECQDIVNYARLFYNLTEPKEIRDGESSVSLSEDSFDRDSVLYNVLYVGPNGKLVGKAEVESGAIHPTLKICFLDTPDAGTCQAFVNGIRCNGGVHVNKIYTAVSGPILETIGVGKKHDKSKRRAADLEVEIANRDIDKRAPRLTMADVKSHLSIIVNAMLPNPKFDAQTKNNLTSPDPRFHLSREDVACFAHWNLISSLQIALDAKNQRELLRSDGRKTKFVDVKNLDDAHFAGRARSSECTLIVVEGLSAMQYPSVLVSAMNDGSVRDFFGIFPIRGKPLNVMNASTGQLAKNREFVTIKKALGLKEGVDYSIQANRDTLRYGRMMIMADADDDGKHIIALLLCLFAVKFHTLLATGYIMLYRAPYMRVTKGRETIEFLSLNEYNSWKEETENFESWTHKYYKGLGTYTETEAKKHADDPFFACFVYDDSAPEAIQLAFDGQRSDDRKKWMSEWQRTLGITDMREVPVSMFIKDELIYYAESNLVRSIPGLDGFKESQRKAMWGAMLHWRSSGEGSGIFRNNPKEFKVAQLASYIADQTRYHHGEKILSDVIVHMCQDFVGSNNIPYFEKDGMFGTRDFGGKDAANTRYSYTRPSKILNSLFNKHDIPIMDFRVDEGYQIEPKVMLPIVPLFVVNGAAGIATAFSTWIPNHNPEDVVCWLLARLAGNPHPQDFVPWYEGFTGRITTIEKKVKLKLDPSQTTETVCTDMESLGLPVDDEPSGSVAPEITPRFEEDLNPAAAVKGSRTVMISTGTMDVVGHDRVVVSELPIGRWTNDYDEWLRLQVKAGLVQDYKNCKPGNNKILFQIKTTRLYSEKDLRLIRSYGMSNMVILDTDNRPHKHKKIGELMERFYEFRLPYYHKRKVYLLEDIQKEIKKHEEKAKFIRLVIDGTIPLVRQRVKQEEIVALMSSHSLPVELLSSVRASGFIEEDITKHESEIVELKKTFDLLNKKTIQDLWTEDLLGFVEVYKEYIVEARKKRGEKKKKADTSQSKE